MTSTRRSGVTRSASEPSRLTLGTSTVTTRSASRRICSGATSRWQPGSERSDSGSSAGVGEGHLDVLPVAVEHQGEREAGAEGVGVGMDVAHHADRAG